MSNEESKVKKLLHRIEDWWLLYKYYICIFLGIVIGVLHYFGWVVNIRASSANVVTFASIVIGIMGVFLTLLITLQESPAFSRLGKYLPAIQTKLYKSLRSQINYGLIVVILSIAINSMPAAPFKYLASIGVFIWFTFFWLMTLGSFYSVKLITDLIVKNFNIPLKTPRQ